MRIKLLFICFITLTSCEHLTTPDYKFPKQEILGFTPKSGKKGDVISVDVDLKFTEEQLQSLIEGNYRSHKVYLLRIDDIFVTDYIEATNNKIVFKIPAGAKSGKLVIDNGLYHTIGDYTNTILMIEEIQ